MRIVASDQKLDAKIAQLWRARLRVSDKGKVLPDEANVDAALRYAPDLAGLVRYNAFSNKIELTGSPPWRDAIPGSQWSDRDDTAAMQWMQREGIGIRSAPAISRCVEAVAHDFEFHPVREYLNAITWDGKPRISTWLQRYVGAKGDDQYLSAVGRRWLISAVARVFQPGCQADHALVLEGIQGAGKSRTARALAVRPEWFIDRLPDIHTADAAIQLAGCWICELGELAAIRKTENEGVKAYLSRTYDNYRPPYGRYRISVPRQCVFIGSTNEATYLTDRTGNRRYWPVACGDIDLEYLEADRDQLWAEAYAAYVSCEPWYLDSEEQRLASREQDERVHVSELEEVVAAYLRRQEATGAKRVELRDIFIHALNLEPDKPDYVERAGRIGNQVTGVLRSYGWVRLKIVGRGKDRRNVYEKQQISSTSQDSLL